MVITKLLWQKIGVFSLAIALLIGCDLLDQQTPTADPPVQTSTETTEIEVEVETETELETTTEADTAQPRLYWLKDEGDRFTLIPTEFSVQDTPENQLTALFQALLTTPPEAEFSSTIPQGTELLSLEVQADGVVVNLSEDFQFGGGSSSMMGRLGQVIYTATSLDPEASVWLQIEGEPLELLGGEGLEVSQPMTRNIFDAEFEL
ncbi:MAG: GerMN domain-containing protein [Limnothrix sp.]